MQKRVVAISLFALLSMSGGISNSIAMNYEPCYPDGVSIDRMYSNIRLYGYYSHLIHQRFDNNTKILGFGTKLGPYGKEWYSFVIELCHGEFIKEERLKYGKPGFIGGDD
ncbi:hypothetical protein [Devosia sp.]|uniref:hypothetical protein n=1 Tax=Devosia sp. TaxID=1871048 RepID=UPI003BAC93AE